MQQTPCQERLHTFLQVHTRHEAPTLRSFTGRPRFCSTHNIDIARDSRAQPAFTDIRPRCTHLAGCKVLAGEGLHSQDRLLLRGEAPHSHTLGAAHTGWELPHSPVAARHILVAACCTSAHTDNVYTKLQAGCIGTPAFGSICASATALPRRSGSGPAQQHSAGCTGQAAQQG